MNMGLRGQIGAHACLSLQSDDRLVCREEDPGNWDPCEAVECVSEAGWVRVDKPSNPCWNASIACMVAVPEARDDG